MTAMKKIRHIKNKIYCENLENIIHQLDKQDLNTYEIRKFILELEKSSYNPNYLSFKDALSHLDVIIDRYNRIHKDEGMKIYDSASEKMEFNQTYFEMLYFSFILLLAKSMLVAYKP
jgi:predicted nucleotidyltransferase